MEGMENDFYQVAIFEFQNHFFTSASLVWAVLVLLHCIVVNKRLYTCVQVFYDPINTHGDWRWPCSGWLSFILTICEEFWVEMTNMVGFFEQVTFNGEVWDVWHLWEMWSWTWRGWVLKMCSLSQSTHSFLYFLPKFDYHIGSRSISWW